MMDFINACFNAVAALFVMFNAIDIYRKKDVAGHTYPSAVFFMVWAVFSILYFASLDQWWTLWATVSMSIANGVLLLLVFKYRRMT